MSQFVCRRGRAVDPAVEALGDPGDVDAEDLEAAIEADEDREAADEAELDRLEAENPELTLSEEEVRLGHLAVEKVRFWRCVTLLLG